jgi:uncharacterized phage protein gp47/JayE
MSDTLDDTGLTLQSLTDIVDDLTAKMQAIYGTDINIDADSPDGQMINIFAQMAIDLRELLQSIYTSMDPDQASGTILDQRVTINGIARNGATYTTTPVDITVDRAVSLVGLDDATLLEADFPSGVYTIKDDAGTQWVLLASVSLTAGLHSLSFRSVDAGAVLATIGTITTAVTVIAGVTAINNSSGVEVQGVDEETDTALRIRRKKSLALSSTGYLDSIQSNILALDGVTACVVTENVSDTTDSNGIPAHSLWVIVEGGTDADIAAAIYATKSAGSGLYGSTVITITRPNGRTIDISFDRPTDANLYIKFGLVVTGGGTVDTDNLKTLIVENVVYGVGASAIGSDITYYVRGLNSLYQVTGMLISKDNATWLEVVAPTSPSYRFILNTARITIS